MNNTPNPYYNNSVEAAQFPAESKYPTLYQAGDELPMQWIWGFPEPTRRLKLIHTEGAVAKIKWVMN
jgi:hypothetical protein